MTDPDKKDFLKDIDISSASFSRVLHALRAPLNSISGFTLLLRKEFYGPLSDEQREFLEIIQRNADEMQILIDRLSVAVKSRENS